MADDVAGLLSHLKLEKSDIFGYGMGAGVALQLAIRHPDLIEKLVIVSGSYTSEGMYPELLSLIPTITPAIFEGSPFKKEYDSLAPNPEKFPLL